MGQMKALYKVHKDFFDGSQEEEAIELKAQNQLWLRIGHDVWKSAVEGYTKKGWMRVKFKWGVKNVQRRLYMWLVGV